MSIISISLFALPLFLGLLKMNAEEERWLIPDHHPVPPAPAPVPAIHAAATAVANIIPVKPKALRLMFANGA